MLYDIEFQVADAITGLIAVPFKFQAALLQRWTLPAFMCQLLTFIETLSLSVSVFTLTGSAVDRFIVVMVRWKNKSAVVIPEQLYKALPRTTSFVSHAISARIVVRKAL